MNDEPKKKYCSIGEAAQQLGLKEHVLRQWEKDFPKDLQPRRSSSNHRRYTEEDIQVLRRIKYLVYHEKLQLDGARLRLEAERYESGGLRNVQELSYTIDAIADAARAIITLYDPDQAESGRSE
ncbi:MAG: MerR family transcriptional regulator [Candidatus Hydrogenedens sp.]|jgi:DNA-binding transcriptional MerR regulator|nr:MerR family transcriptional regulator [Candidatus Hydrogenedens sp.]